MLPIRGVVMFPYMTTPFVVGRKSSMRALEEALAGDRKIFMATQRDASAEDPKLDEIFSAGTIVNIVQSLKLPTGHIKILVEGLERAKAVSVSGEGGFFRADVQTFGAETKPGPELDALASRVLRRSEQYIGMKLKRQADLALPGDDPDKLPDYVCANLPLTLEEKQELLEIFDPVERLARVADILDREVRKLTMLEGTRELLRHTVATLAYRASKAVRGAPAEFAEYRSAPDSRTPAEILAHMGDLFDWALALCEGRHEWHDSPPLAWDQGVARFFAALEAFDRRLSAGVPLGFPAETIFQGPIADALTHVGQIAMLRRLAGSKMRGENYFVAKIVVGRVGVEQADAVREFD
jgi:Lon protease-like protein